MNSRERALTALNHKEPDRIPLDFGGSICSTIHVNAYAALRKHLGLPEKEIRLSYFAGQVAKLDDDFLEKLRVDTGMIYQPTSMKKEVKLRDEGEYLAFTDGWGVGWHKPKAGGLYYDMYQHPFDVEIDEMHERLKTYTWPDAKAPEIYSWQKERAVQVRQSGKLGMLGGFSAGPVERHAWLRGFYRSFTDFGSELQVVEMFMDKIVELKVTYWERALAEAGEHIDVAVEGDDFAGQDRMFISPKTYREIVKPRHKQVFDAIKKAAPHVKILLHSCGAIRPVIPDLIEIGVDAINPVQISAKDMGPIELKKEFGEDIVFWGGGVDTQRVFSTGTPQDVRDDVKRNIEALAPGGGFIFTPVHNTQADVPVENFMAMWETLQEYGVYK